jgi:hypothetical protein
MAIFGGGKFESTDCSGRVVRVGYRVRIRGFSESFMESLPPEEQAQISEMVGGVFEVEDIDDAGQAWVTKWWDLGDGNADAHDIGLAPSEMELVTPKVAEGPS